MDDPVTLNELKRRRRVFGGNFAHETGIKGGTVLSDRADLAGPDAGQPG